MSVLEIVILMAYGLMLIELLFLPVPSEASTYRLLVLKRNAKEQQLSNGLLGARRIPLGRKLLIFLLPVSLTVMVFSLPLLQILFFDLKNYLFPIPVFEQPLFQWLAGGLILFGSGITLLSVLEMRVGIKKNSSEQTAPGLWRQGTFRWSRNPGLVGNYVLFLGLFFYLPSWVMVFGFWIYLLNMHHRILLEESQLEARFGETYRAYRRHVPRYLCFCGRARVSEPNR